MRKPSRDPPDLALPQRKVDLVGLVAVLGTVEAKKLGNVSALGSHMFAVVPRIVKEVGGVSELVGRFRTLNDPSSIKTLTGKAVLWYRNFHRFILFCPLKVTARAATVSQ